MLKYPAMRNHPQILVVGGGIAGLSFALQLARRGISATIWEKQSPLNFGGYVVGIWKNGFDVLEKLGVADKVRQHGKISEFQHLTDENGNTIRYTDLKLLNQKHQSTVMFMQRNTLINILRKEVGDTAVMRFGVSIAAVQEEETGIRVSSDVMSDAKSFDLVVGADGIGSGTRRLVFGEDGIVRHNGVFYYTSVSMAQWQSRPQGDIEMTGPETFLGLYPFSEEHCGVYAAVYRRPDLLDMPAAAVMKHYFLNFNGYVPSVLQQIEEAEIFGDVIREVRLPKWHAGRCMLIGDAAHAMLPTTGQGLSLALEDGWLLANIIADTPQQQWTAEFTAFEKSRRRRMMPIYRRAALSNFVVHHTPAFLCKPRNMLIRCLFGKRKLGTLNAFLKKSVTRDET